ncbi:MAG: hypothetical protein P0S96_05190 [Simkaniaceae bacterium]|nr:hypothetical protein [Candidatus Sacchlamyda saccharinae]
MFHKNSSENRDSLPNIKKIVNAKDWKFLVKNTLPVNIADIYSFSEAMHIVDFLIDSSVEEMIEDGFTADLMRDYSVNLMNVLRAKYSHEWEKDWKNEAYLGITCGLVFRAEEAFQHIEKAYKQLENPPQSLILAYISAGSGPDQYLTKKQITELSQNAVEQGVTYETSLRMATLAKKNRDTEKQNYWENKAAEAEKNGVHTPIIIPNVMKDAINREDRRRYEV